MLFGKSADNPHAVSMPLVVIVCLKSAVPRIRRLLARHAQGDWEREGDIHVVDALRRDHSWETSSRIQKIAPRGSAALIVSLERTRHEERFGELGDELRTHIEFHSLSKFESQLPELLKQFSLDWQSVTAKRLAAWHHHEITIQHIDLWLRQFERLRERWLGEKLLRALDFWTPAKLRHAATIGPDLNTNFDCICLNRIRLGKSADFLANIFSKAAHSQFPSFPLFDLSAFLTDAQSVLKYPRVLFLEDCLLTGTEMTNFFSALLGLRHPSGREWKYPSLNNPSLLRATEIQLRFAVATDLGIWRLRRFLDLNELPNINIEVPSEGLLEILTPNGKIALENNTFYESDPELTNCVREVEKNIYRKALAGPWRDDAQLERATNFLQRIGGELFREYLSRALYKWDERKIAPCAFGMHGLGLVLGFSHSIPKSSLPVFWADGTISAPSGTCNWTPLFPNAAF